MTDFIFRLFVKDAANTADPKVRFSYGQVAGIVGVFTNLLLVASKLTVGFLSGSISIIADALNNLSDAASSIVTFVGFRLAAKPADAEHPYGHARIEYVTGLIISMTVIFIGLQMALKAFDKILHPTETEISIVTLAVLCISIVLKLWQGFFHRKAARKIDSDSLRAASTDSFSDVLLTCTVLLGAFLTKLFGWKLDGWFGLAVALFIMLSGVKLVIETSSPLLGIAPDPSLVKKVSAKILSYEGILGIHDLVFHSYGAGNTFVSAHAEVDADENILDAHERMDRIEADCLQELGIRLVLHMDPVVRGDARIEGLQNQLAAILFDLYPGMTFHDFRVVFGKERTNLIFDVVVPIGFTTDDKEICRRVQERFRETDPTIYTVITVDRDYTATLFDRQ